MLTGHEMEMATLLPIVYWMKLWLAHHEFIEDLLGMLP